MCPWRAPVSEERHESQGFEVFERPSMKRRIAEAAAPSPEAEAPVEEPAGMFDRASLRLKVAKPVEPLESAEIEIPIHFDEDA